MTGATWGFIVKMVHYVDLTNKELKESFGPREENSSLKGPLLNHLTSERTKHNFSYILMLQASCIYLGLISPVRKPTTPSTRPEDLSPPAQLQVLSQQRNTQIPPD